jgi:type II secretory pathway pseudopilin PulG
MALMVASILLTAIAPLVALAVASRVQARRVDLATQAARSYVDGLRANVILPPTRNNAVFNNTQNLNVPAPQGLQDLTRCVNKNIQPVPCNNPDWFLGIQAFRDGAPNGADIPPTVISPQTQAVIKRGYCLGVRVYRSDAFKGGNPAPENIQPLRPLITETSKTKYYPLAVVRTEIINQASFEDYELRFPRTNPTDPNSLRKANPCN